VRCHGCGYRVCFPDIHFRAARAVATYASIGVVAGWLPAVDVSLDIY
jgi:hypothetical protein